ncbi:Regulator of nonsense transcripts 1 homolog [Durusdinium trenchii]|uniref:Regulator of nonsense transcripts 1 homolog n=1 Tax=Durusdinium trenchii TaxID=1381693 RepID=A0ABP0S955_9DINO
MATAGYLVTFRDHDESLDEGGDTWVSDFMYVSASMESPDAVELCSCLCPEAYAACLRQTREEPIVVTTPEEYAEAWRGLVEVEAAASAVEEGLGRHLTDVWVDWEESEGVTYGRFEVKAALLFAHKIKFRSAMPLGEWGSSWLCVRRHLKGGGVPWHGHGAVIKASFDEKDLIFAEEDDTWQDSGSSLRITFRVIATAPRRSGENGLASGYAPPVNGFYLLELIPKALAESCMALALEELPHCPLVQRLVLAGPSDERSLAPAPEVVEVAALLDSLNDSQRRAVHYALRHPLAQVQGPPGTGKTMTTAVLATCFAWQNMSSGENRAVLLCTPTNRAADCAASFVARVCRRYAERRLEARSAEGTQCAVCLGGKPNTITLCGHPFHQSCLAQALELGSRCPICRRRVKHIETGLRILRIYGNEHAGLEARKVFEVPEELRRFSLHWRCHGASDDEHCTAEARKTRKAYRASVMNSGEGANGAAKNRSNLPFLVRANGVDEVTPPTRFSRFAAKPCGGPRADQLRRTYQQAG